MRSEIDDALAGRCGYRHQLPKSSKTCGLSRYFFENSPKLKAEIITGDAR